MNIIKELEEYLTENIEFNEENLKDEKDYHQLNTIFMLRDSYVRALKNVLEYLQYLKREKKYNEKNN